MCSMHATSALCNDIPFVCSVALPSYSCVLEGRGGRNARTHLWCLFLCSVRHALSYRSWLVWRLGCVNSSQGLQEVNSPNLLSALQPKPVRSSPAMPTWCVWRGNIPLGSCTRTMLANTVTFLCSIRLRWSDELLHRKANDECDDWEAIISMSYYL